MIYIGSVGSRDDRRLRVNANFYYMAVGAGLNPDLAAVFISSRLSLLFCILMQSVGLDFFR